MKLERHVVLIGIAALALGVTGCAADRAKAARQAETRLTNAQIDAENEQRRLEAKQERERAKAIQDGKTPKERAEMLTEQIDETAEIKTKGTEKVAEAREKVTGAHAAMATERTKVEADAKERLTKADARVVEAKTKGAKLGAGERAKFDAEMKTFEGKRADVDKHLADLGHAADADWKAAKAKVQKDLDDIEAAVKRLEKHL